MNKRIVKYQRICILAHEDRLWMDSLFLYSFPSPSLPSPFVLLLSYNSIIGWFPLSDLLHYFNLHISFNILLFSFSNLAFSDLILSTSDSTILFLHSWSNEYIADISLSTRSFPSCNPPTAFEPLLSASYIYCNEVTIE